MIFLNNYDIMTVDGYTVKILQKGDAIMFNLKEELVKAMEMFVQKEYVPATADGIQFFGCMDCSNSCAENCAVKCKKNGKK